MGVELKIASKDLAVPFHGASVKQFVENTNGQNPDLDFSNFDTIPLRWLEGALPRMSQHEQDMMLRHKIIPYIWLPQCVIYGAATEHGLRWARAQGFSVVGRILIEDYRSLVRRKLAPALLNVALTTLESRLPWASAKRRLSWSQILTSLATLAVLLGIVMAYGAQPLWLATSIIAALFFGLVVYLRLLCLQPLPHASGVVAPLLPDETLPNYTVLVPLFKETAVLPQLMHALSCLDYPREKLDIKIILEENDTAMHQALQAFDVPNHFDVLIVPAGKPQTKPRALNYALLFARGDLVTIYDSEDIPQPNQLKLAAAQMAASHESVACLQAALEFYNPNENWLTRQFTAEYAALFHVILPTLAAYKLPLLLGGTSNHFRMSALKAVGGWDAFNVTEDADLGIRLARFGYQTGVLHSSTFEEANVNVWNWLKQRRRWLKGFLQTWLVHNRNPLLLLKEVGPFGFCAVQCMTLGIFLSSLVHPVFLLITAWNFLPPQFFTKIGEPNGPIMAYASFMLLLAGYFSGILLSARGLRRAQHFGWFRTLIGIPAYWLLMSVAAWLALWDFCVAPHHWHKTRHGLSRSQKTTGQPLISRPLRRLRTGPE
jgi:glycosyltransferase XagB